MENCPNCQNNVCVNPSFTHFLNILDLVTESNSFELEMNEEFQLMEFILSEDFINRHRKPRRVPSKIPRRANPNSTADLIFRREQCICRRSPPPYVSNPSKFRR